MHFLNSAYPNITKDPIYLDEISEETLEIAAKIYFRTIFCPDYDVLTLKFYQELIENFSLETVLKTLARISFVANENKLEKDFLIAKDIFDEMSKMMKLQYRDIAVVTTGASELQLYQELTTHQTNLSLLANSK